MTAAQLFFATAGYFCRLRSFYFFLFFRGRNWSGPSIIQLMEATRNLPEGVTRLGAW